MTENYKIVHQMQLLSNAKNVVESLNYGGNAN